MAPPRDTTVYAKGMDASLADKWRQVRHWIAEVCEGRKQVIVDEGCGTGKLLRLLAERYQNAAVYGRDASPEFVRHSLLETHGLPNVSVVRRDIALPFLKRGTVTTKIFSSVLHEIATAQGPETLRSVLRRSFYELCPGGRMLIRDGIKPDPELVFLWLDPNRYQRRPDLGMLSARERFFCFVRDFAAVRSVPYYRVRVREVAGERLDWLIAIQSEDAYEFLMKKDYVENWDTEIREYFGFWTLAEWQHELTQAGFSVQCMSAFRNSWINEHRIKPSARLFRLNDKGVLGPMHFFATNIFAVAQRPKDMK